MGGYFNYPTFHPLDFSGFSDAADRILAEVEHRRGAEALKAEQDRKYGLDYWTQTRADARLEDESRWNAARAYRAQGEDIAKARSEADKLFGSSQPSLAEARLADVFWLDQQGHPHFGLENRPTPPEPPLPALPTLPTRENVPPGLAEQLQRGSTLAAGEAHPAPLRVAEDKVRALFGGGGPTPLDRPPSEEEFSRWSGGPGAAGPQELGAANALTAGIPFTGPAVAQAPGSIQQEATRAATAFKNPDYQREARAYIAERDSYPQRRAEAEAARAAEEARRAARGPGHVISGGPSGKEVTVYEGEARQRNAASNAADAAAWQQSVVPQVATIADPRRRANANTAAGIVQGEIASGSMPVKQAGAALNAWIAKLDAADQAADLKKQGWDQAMERAKVMARAQAGKAAGGHDFEADKFRIQNTNQGIDRLFGKDSDTFKRTQTLNTFSGLKSQLTSDDPAAQKLALIAAYKDITGDTRLSDADRNFVISATGDIWDQITTAKNYVTNGGRLSPDQVTNLTKALDIANKSIESLVAKQVRQSERMFDNTRLYDPQAYRSFVDGMGWTDYLTPGFGEAAPPKPRLGKRGGASAAIGKAPKGAVPAAAPPSGLPASLDDVEKILGGAR